MQVRDKVVVVTGGAGGIGRALAERFHREGARAVVVADRDGAGAEAVARAIGGAGFACDVGREADVVHLVEETERRIGPIGLFCSNAGIARFDPPGGSAASAPNESWEQSWAVNVMAHVYAARALLPRMIARGGGYFLHTASAAGLLSQIGGAVYATTKHAAVGFAEILAITHRDDGIRVSILCPQGVDTAMLRSIPGSSAEVDGVLTPEQVADATVAGLERESFLILPHPQVQTYMQNKLQNYDRWLGGMAKLRRSLAGKASRS
ncbi:MAG TPA: SDR family oxidoreductase [Stellaceae bacterium]|nr:SDR family oxidoreductase [Stellaceae bacterium]